MFAIGLSIYFQPCRMFFILTARTRPLAIRPRLKIWHRYPLSFFTFSPIGFPSLISIRGFSLLRASVDALGRVPLRWEELQDLRVETSLFQLSHEALRAEVDGYGDDRQSDIKEHQVDPDTLKYQCKLFGTLRREENKIMQLSSCTCNSLH